MSKESKPITVKSAPEEDSWMERQAIGIYCRHIREILADAIIDRLFIPPYSGNQSPKNEKPRGQQ